MGNFKLLRIKDIFGENACEIMKKYNKVAQITDYAIMQGSCFTSLPRSQSDKITGAYFTRTENPVGNVLIVTEKGEQDYAYCYSYNIGIRPVIEYSEIEKNAEVIKNVSEDLSIVEYGEYPQFVVDYEKDGILERKYLKGNLQKTGKIYDNNYEEYEDEDGKYIRVIPELRSNKRVLNNLDFVCTNHPYWIKVSKVRWLVSNKDNMAISSKILFRGRDFDINNVYLGNFENTKMYEYLNDTFKKDLSGNYQNLEEVKKKYMN